MIRASFDEEAPYTEEMPAPNTNRSGYWSYTYYTLLFFAVNFFLRFFLFTKDIVPVFRVLFPIYCTIRVAFSGIVFSAHTLHHFFKKLFKRTHCDFSLVIFNLFSVFIYTSHVISFAYCFFWFHIW